MDRTIKFRGKSLTTGEWLYGSHFNDGAEDYILPNVPSGADDYERYQVDLNTVGQYTGLCDKNDNEIYEGDILQMNGSAKLEVQFLHGGFGYCLMFGDVLFGGNSSFRFNPFDKDESFEVIGNIHDNKELLKKEA